MLAEFYDSLSESNSPKSSKFKKFIAAINDRNWQEAADQMVDSRWYNQVPNRAQRLEQRMRAVT